MSTSRHNFRGWTISQVDELRRRRARGETLAWIARQMGRSVQSIQRASARFDKPRRFAWTPERLAMFRELHEQGYSDPDIAAELGCDRQVINRLRRRHGISPNAYNDRHRKKLATRQRIAAMRRHRQEAEALR